MAGLAGIFKKLGGGIADKKRAKEALMQRYSEEPGEKAIEAAFKSSWIMQCETEEKDNLKNSSAMIILRCDRGNYDQEAPWFISSEKLVHYKSDGVYVKRFTSDLRLSPGKSQIITGGSYQKKSSVVGSAAAGAVVAGGVGAVVGAVAAASSNANGGRTVYRSSLGNHGLWFGTRWVLDCYLSEAMLERFGNPFEGGEMINGFLKLSTYNRDEEYIEALVEYLRSATAEFAEGVNADIEEQMSNQ